MCDLIECSRAAFSSALQAELIEGGREMKEPLFSLAASNDKTSRVGCYLQNKAAGQLPVVAGDQHLKFHPELYQFVASVADS